MSEVMADKRPMCGQNAAGLCSFRSIEIEKREKADFLRTKSGRAGKKRITPADGRPIIGQEWINFRSDLRIVGQKRQEGSMKRVSPRSPAKIILTKVNMWVNMQP